MSELGEMWKEVKTERQNKRWDNYEKSKQILIENKVEFEEKPNGHFIIYDGHDNPIYDIWLTTGKFISRETKESGRGINNLIRKLTKE